jgi:hypothetical protein
VANTLKSQGNGAVGFTDWLGLYAKQFLDIAFASAKPSRSNWRVFAIRVAHELKDRSADTLFRWEANYMFEERIPYNHVEFLSQRTKMFSEKVAPLLLKRRPGLKFVRIKVQNVKRSLQLTA